MEIEFVGFVVNKTIRYLIKPKKIQRKQNSVTNKLVLAGKKQLYCTVYIQA